MQGQWQDQFDGGELILVDIDSRGGGYEGHIYLFPPNLDIVVSSYFFSETSAPLIKAKVGLTYHPFGRAETIPIQKVRELFPQGRWPETMDLSLQIEGENLVVEAFGDLSNGTQSAATATLPASRSDQVSELNADAEIVTWEKFKQLVGGLEKDRFIFRGQPVQKRLRSSFHRTNRKSLLTYIRQDIPRLHRALSTSTRSYFDLDDDNHYAAFMNLLQHHGYPTPLLDWTYSPYVAAYFAFRHARKTSMPEDRVRIFMFDAANWRKLRQFNSLVFVPPHISLLDPLPLENPRSAPQQSLSAIVTVDDVEGYLETVGKKMGCDYLRVFDLPYAERKTVLQELRFMGITAASLFPGFDGTCDAMRFLNFED